LKQSDWETIHALAEAARMAAETRLAPWLRREAGLTVAIERLAEQAITAPPSDMPAERARADVLWQKWCDLRRSEALAELARVRYRKVASEEALRQAVRRSIATEAVLRTERARLARKLDLRTEREGNG
jgi:cell division protein FtsB